MATLASIDIGTLITNSPKIWGGKAIVAGTRVPVFIVVTSYQGGMTPEEIATDRYLSFAQVYAAITYYQANRAIVEREMTEYEEEVRQGEAEWHKMRAEGRA
jgi:uncharacterized protein (DUF433 family)